eukprot:Em0025g37a
MVYFKDRPVAPVKARLILDSSSQKSYISAELKDMLKPPLEQSVTMSIKTFGSEAENLVQACDIDLATLDKKCQAFWEFDSLGIREEQDYSIVATVFQLPWKEPHPLLPDNFDLSKGRLLNLLKQLQQTPNILSQYDSIIQDQMEMTAADIEKAFLMVTVAEEDREALFFLAPASSSDQLNVTDSPVTYDESYTKNTLGDKLEVSESSLLSSVAGALQSEQVLDRPICFTDSKIALYWIRRFDKKWKQNRVNEVGSSSPLTQSTHQGETILNCEHVSTLGQLLKVTARGMKFIILKTKIKSASLMAADFEGAEMYWVMVSRPRLVRVMYQHNINKCKECDMHSLTSHSALRSGSDDASSDSGPSQHWFLQTLDQMGDPKTCQRVRGVLRSLLKTNMRLVVQGSPSHYPCMKITYKQPGEVMTFVKEYALQAQSHALLLTQTLVPLALPPSWPVVKIMKMILTQCQQLLLTMKSYLEEAVPGLVHYE